MTRHLSQIAAIVAVALFFGSSLIAQEAPVRKPSEDVNAPDVRARQGLRPDEHLLFNGWGVTPAGKHLPITGSSTVSAIDTSTNQNVRDLTVGLRPNDMALAPDGRLFVACSGDNTVHVIMTKTVEKAPEAASPARRLWEGTREVISTSLYPQSPEGSTPDALAVSPDGKMLYVANADNNDVMAVDISRDRLDDKVRKNKESVSIVAGFIPVGWYPSAIAAPTTSMPTGRWAWSSAPTAVAAWSTAPSTRRPA